MTIEKIEENGVVTLKLAGWLDTQAAALLAEQIEALITPRTRVIVPVHYAGVACDMDKIMALAEKYSLIVVEDAAQAIDSYYKGRPLGTI